MSYYTSNFFSEDRNLYANDASYYYYHHHLDFNPNFVKHDSYHHSHAPSNQSLVFYSVSNPKEFPISYGEFDEPEFADYDPTPYGGGYDIAATYGEPLPPSDKTCYPRSVPIPNHVVPDKSSHGSMEFLTKEGEIVEPSSPNVSELSRVDQDEAEAEAESPSDDDGKKEGSSTGSMTLCDDYYYYPWSGYGKNEYENLGNFKESEVPQTDPFGYSSEATDLCESLFGYWPCLYRKQRKDHHHGDQLGGFDHEEESFHGDRLSGAADYFFGDSYYDSRSYS